MAMLPARPDPSKVSLAPPKPIENTPHDPADMTHQLATILGVLKGDDFTANAATATAPEANDTPALSPVAAPDLAPLEGIADSVAKSKILLKAEPVAKQPDSRTPEGFGGDNLRSGSWAHDLLATLNLPATEQNVRALTAWQKAEGGGSDGPSKSNFNWLNTTQSVPGATSINKVGVKSYANYHDGLMATAQTLTNGRYGNILSALAAGNDAMAVGRAIEGSPWGTGGGTLRVLGSR